ncbi:MAG: hypothetical protein LBD02_07435 [Christensenellaceae bacterium]|jgi:hypothetical protein|nr:hypothetical protein [Christensenellaceae bacterium]
MKLAQAIHKDSLKNHFSYSWWAYLLAFVLLWGFWSFAYSATRYVPPREKSLTINFVGSYVPQEFLDEVVALGLAAFPELEQIEAFGITFDEANDAENAYLAEQKLQVMIAANESDLFFIDKSLLAPYAGMGAFAPLDDLLAGGALAGSFSAEELSRGRVNSAELGEHLFGLPAERFFRYYERFVDPRRYFLCLSELTPNREYAEKMLILLAEDGLTGEKPEWVYALEQQEQKAKDEAKELTPIG